MRREEYFICCSSLVRSCESEHLIHPSDPKAEKAFFLLPNVDLALTLLSFRAAPCVCSYDISGEGR